MITNFINKSEYYRVEPIGPQNSLISTPLGLHLWDTSSITLVSVIKQNPKRTNGSKALPDHYWGPETVATKAVEGRFTSSEDSDRT